MATALVLVTACVGASAGWFVGERTAPASLPPMPTELPEAANRYLSGVTVDGIEAVLPDDAAPCRESGAILGAARALFCDLVWLDRPGRGLVGIGFDHADRVTEILVVCQGGLDVPRPTGHCRVLAAAVMDAALPGRPTGIREHWTSWVERNVCTDAVTLLADVELVLEFHIECRLRILPRA